MVNIMYFAIRQYRIKSCGYVTALSGSVFCIDNIEIITRTPVSQYGQSTNDDACQELSTVPGTQ
jgi:hypothetical protein